MRFILLLLFPLLFVGCSQTINQQMKHHEKYYQTLLCDKLHGEMEFVLEDRTRVDCLTDEYAIEVDFAKKWAESIGQSLFYAHMTGKEPAVGLIIDTSKESRYLKRLDVIAQEYGIKIFILQKYPQE